jgi:hypothetical protein
MKFAPSVTTRWSKSHLGFARNLEIFFVNNDMNDKRAAGGALTIVAMASLCDEGLAANFVADVSARALS